MDDRRIDHLAKRLGTSRRGLFKRVIGLCGAAVAARLGAADAEAARRGYEGPSDPNGPGDETRVCPRPSCCAICPLDYSVLNQFAMCVVLSSQSCAGCAQAAIGCRLA